MDLCYYHYHFRLCAACNINSTLAINSSQQNSFRECLCGNRSLVSQNHNHRLSFHKHNRSLFSHTFSWEKKLSQKSDMHDFTMCSVSQIQLRSGALCRERCKSEMSMGRPYYNRIAHLDNAQTLD